LSYASYDSEYLNSRFLFSFGISLNDASIGKVSKCNGVLLNFNITNEALELAIYFNEDFVDKLQYNRFWLYENFSSSSGIY
jgi:hypothetical protein